MEKEEGNSLCGCRFTRFGRCGGLCAMMVLIPSYGGALGVKFRFVWYFCRDRVMLSKFFLETFSGWQQKPFK